MAELSNIGQRLTSNQIADFNNPLAFARPRSDSIETGTATATSTRRVGTGDIEASYRLVSGAVDRLETLYGNLGTMLELVESARGARGNERRTAEIFGKLRSLGAGFDQVVDSMRFDGRTVFAGSKVQLSLGSGARPIQLETKNLSTYGEGGLNLSQTAHSAEVSLRISGVDAVLNSNQTVPGLEMTQASFVPPSAPVKELESGTYNITITYAGPESAVELREQSGRVIERVENVDLSGDGMTQVDFDSGVRIEFDKDNPFLTYDKYDYETLGPAKISSTLVYRRLDRHILTTEETPRPEEAEFAANASLRAGGGTLSLEDPSVVAGEPGRTLLESGRYSLSVEYGGRNSVVRLHDASGRLVGHQFGVDLSESGRTRIDLGVGLAFDLVNDDFSSEKTRLSVPLDYHRDRPAVEDFDFREFGQRVKDAMEVVLAQWELFSDAKAEIEQTSQQRNEARGGNVPSLATFRGQNTSALLSGMGGGFSFPGMGGGQGQVSGLGMQLFQTANAAHAQANQTEESVRMARQAAASDWLGGLA